MIDTNTLAAYLDVDPGTIIPERLAVLEREAVSLIRAYKNTLPIVTAEWPENAKIVALRVVGRGYARPDTPGMSSHSLTAGPFQQSYGFSPGSTSGALYLTKQDKAMLDGKSKGRAYSIDLLMGDYLNGQPNNTWEGA